MSGTIRGAVELARLAAAGARAGGRRTVSRRGPSLADAAAQREVARAFAELGATLAAPAPAAAAGASGERLGDALVRRGLLSPADLERALAAHRVSGERLGRVLLSMGLVRRQDLHRVLGDLWGVGFCDLTRIDLDEHLVRRLPPSEMAAEGWVPIDRRGNVVWVATAEPPDPRVAETLSRELEMEIEVQFLATTEWDVNAVLREVFADRLADEAANALYDRNPLASARHGLTRGQRVTLLRAAMVTAAGFTWNPVMAGIVLCSIANLGFLTAVAFKLVTALAGWRSVRHGVVAAAARIPDDELPVYTVLVPVFREANIVGGLVGHLRELDYPQEKLEILLLMEEEDTETLGGGTGRPPAGHGQVRRRPARAAPRRSRAPATWASSSATASSW